MKSRFVKGFAVSLLSASMLAACGGSGSSGGGSDDDNGGGDSSRSVKTSDMRKVLETNADIAYAAYSDSVATALDLQAALKTFREDPTEANFLAAKKAWLVAREPYGQTEVYRFRNSPIDSTDYQSEDGPEGDINAWPLGEALIDYVVTEDDSDFTDDEVGVTDHSTGINYPNENIISSNVAITKALLSNTATATDEHDVISGYHAIEFLLWGQDLKDDANPITDGTDRDEAVQTVGAIGSLEGSRPLSDLSDGYNTTTDLYDDSNASNRRHKYLEVAVEKLIEDLIQVRDAWEDNVDGNYRDQFTSVDSSSEATEKLIEILTGMGTLSKGELAGERMQIAFSANSQEDEHSCFSDNTHRDIWLNAEGVSNSYYGVYAGYDSTLNGADNQTGNAVNGYGFDDLLRDSGMSDLAAEVEAALATTETNYQEIDTQARAGFPVDVLIQSATVTNPMYKTVFALNEQASLLAELGVELDASAQVVQDDATSCDTSQPDTTCD